MSENIELKIVIDGKEAKANLDSAQAGINNLSNAAKNTQNSLNGMKVGSGNATMAVMSLSQAMGDAGGFAYSFRQGMMGVGNNMQMVAQSVMQLRAETGGTKSAISALGSAFMGPMGLMMGINAAITFLPMLIDYFSKSGTAATESSEGLKKYNEQLKDIGAKDLGAEIGQREQIVKAIEEAIAANQRYVGDSTEGGYTEDIDTKRGAALRERLSINQKLLDTAKAERVEKEALAKFEKEISTTKGDPKIAGAIKADQERRGEAVRKMLEEEARLAKEIPVMIAEYRVAVMKEGFEKELAEIDLRYSKEIEKAKGNAELLKLIETARDNERNRVNDKALQAAYERQESEKKFSNFSRQLLKTDSQYQLDWLEKERQQVNANEEYKEGLRKRASEARRQRQIRELKESSAIADEGFSTLYNYTQANKREEVKAALESKLVKLDSDKEEALSKAKTQEEKDAINKSYAAKEKALRDQANDEVKSAGKELFALAKAASIAQATINTYEAATKAMDAAPPPMSFILAGITIAAGMAHVATIAAQQPQGLALGGLVRGAGTGTSDSVPAYLSNGEFVVNARSTAMYYPALRAMNEGRVAVPAFSQPSIARMPANMPSQNTSLRKEIEEIKSILKEWPREVRFRQSGRDLRGALLSANEQYRITSP